MKNFLINALIFLLVLTGGLLVGWHFIQGGVIRYLTQVTIDAEAFDANLEFAVEEAEAEMEEIINGDDTDELDIITTLGPFAWLEHVGVADDLEIQPIGELIMPSIDVRVAIFLGYQEPRISLGAGTYRPRWMRNPANIEYYDIPEKAMGENNFVLASHWDPNPELRFGGIDQIQVGDLLILRDSNYLYLYETIIGDNHIIAPNRIDIAHVDPDHTWLTLFTCTPDGYQRVMVRGEFVEKISISELAAMLEAGELEELEGISEDIIEVVDSETLRDIVETLDETEVPFPIVDVVIATGGALSFAVLIVWISGSGSNKKKKNKKK